MRDGDRGEFEATMTAIFNIYDRDFDEGMIGFYFNALIDFPLGVVRESFFQHANDPDRGQYWPKPADLIRHIQGGKGTRALFAWDKANRAVSAAGYYSTVRFDDPLIHAVVDRMGGWMAFSNRAWGEESFCQRE